MKGILRVLVFLCCLGAAGTALACTTILVGKDASTDGSVLVSHSDDGLGDARLISVPAMDHKPGSMRAVYYSHCALDFKPQWGGSESQRMMTTERGPGYNTPGVPKSVPLGFIPQVAHTYAYFDANYGIMNEHQLSIGECTDKAKVHPEPEAGKRIFYSAELSRVALERCTTAREAIQLMGELIAKYGYYGTGETLLVADPKEGWVFEMCGYDMNGTDGVWVAQRVPDDAFFAAANQFRIREVRENAPDMMYSKNIFDVAKAKGWWKPESGPLDWTAVYGDGEFHHPYYSLRRVWRAMTMVAPSLKLSPWVEGPFTKAYPFTIKPDNKLNPKDIFAIHRDNYEGTEFDLTQGLAAGPFNDPNRFEGQAEGMADKEGRLTPLDGAFERPLNIYRCVYAYVNQSRSWLPDAIGGLTWYGPDRPATAVLLPFHAGVIDLPAPIQKGDALKLERGSLWTAFNYVANYAMLKYSFMIQDIVKVRERYESTAFGEQPALEDKALALWKKGDQKGARKLLTADADTRAKALLKDWWNLSDQLYIKYNDGFLNTKEGLAQEVFYPAWWLKAVGYESGPSTYEKPKK
ncbi:dipeptidase [Desulfovibrio aminophilus]|uniref:dipeptidase n=1 Tax=Desulfovibrio aminophilus TaxID=81425 RepID=UPI00041235FB|nr:C69 family dipeptidase [Desulfovibrio aminophilus]